MKLQGQSSLSLQAGHQTARNDGDCERQGGWEPGWGGRVNRGEPLINVVDENKPKVLSVPTRNHRLGPKGKGPGIGVPNSPIADGASPAKRRNLTHLKQVLTRNVVSPSSSLWESEP